MKEFYKWWEKQLCSNNAEYKTIAYHAWQSALKWALEQEEWQGTDDCGGWGVNKYDIEEELGIE